LVAPSLLLVHEGCGVLGAGLDMLVKSDLFEVKLYISVLFQNFGTFADHLLTGKI
jgi:hypothetical protein